MKDKILRLIKKIAPFIFYFLPVKRNKIVFINFNGKGYGCNPKYIAQEIINQNLDYDLVWLVNDLNEVFPSGIRKKHYGGIKSFLELATAKVIVTNVKNDLHLVKKKSQYIIQTWHGSYSAKLLEKDAEDKLSPQYIKESKENSKQTDLFLSNSKILSQCYRDSFWCECEILECGFPRNDVLFPTNLEEEVIRIKQNLGVSTDTKLILYAPTFRDDGSLDAYNIDCEALLNAMNGDWKILIRLHPNVSNYEHAFNYNDNIIDATSYPDMQELLLAADILITDYSSSIFEFAALKKPSYIYASDVEAYQNMRGLNDSFFNMPYPICRTNEELLQLIREYTPVSGEKAAEEFSKRFGGVDKGDASKQVVKRIREIVEK